MLWRVFKIIIIFILLLAVFFLALYFIFKNKDYSSPNEPQWGVTISTLYVKKLGLNWTEVFQDTINELGVKLLRIPIYWQEVEKTKGKYNFAAVQYMLDESYKKNVNVLLVVGMRQPRWPECHYPVWLNGATTAQIQSQTLKLIKKEVEAFKDHPAVIGWQVENEPLLTLFGKCPDPDPEFLKKEIALVRSLSGQPILITDSGELSLWWRTGALTETLGTTVYRVVWNPLLGFWNYDFIPAAVYHWKASLAKMLHANLNRVIVSELQAEPWVPGYYQSIVTMPLEEQVSVWSPERFRDTLLYAKRIGFDTVYLWGVEWWYWIKKEHGKGEYWEIARELFK